MERESLNLLNGLNRAIIKFRGVYSQWSSEHGISYHEMLVLYTIREHGYCTQKQICERYILPKQTINNVIVAMRKSGLLIPDDSHSKGKEKAFVLSRQGEAYAKPFLKSLDTVENRALEQLEKEKLQTLTDLLLEYDLALNAAMEKSR